MIGTKEIRAECNPGSNGWRLFSVRMASLVQYLAGSFVTLTGMYIFQHTCSRAAQEVLIICGSRFPACPECSGGGRYLLERAAPRPDEDPDFRS